MITLQSIREAVLAPDPYTEMHHLVRKEMDAGRKVKQIFESINPLVEELLDTPGLPEDGEEALLGTLDALTGNCHRDCQYKDPPSLTLPTEEEIATLPRWARVAFAARCAKRVFPQFQLRWDGVTQETVEKIRYAIEITESAALETTASAKHREAMIDAADICVEAMESVFPSEASCHAASAASSAAATASEAAGLRHRKDDTPEPTLHTVSKSWEAMAEAGILSGQSILRRDFDHLTKLAEWQHWTDDTPVPPDVFGPLWPEGPPKGWPADTDLPHRAELTLDLLSRARVLETMTEDETVNLFNKINAYYIARTGTRLTMEDLRPLIAASVLVEV